MLSPELNERLTKVGPGTAAGELLRRYWWPIGISEHLQDRATFIRLLCEDLVLFRNGEGQLGLLASQCAHRRANLCLGSVESDGLRCRYHGWKFGTDGKVLEIPGEPNADKVAQKVRQVSYPVIEHDGMILAYLGPHPAPLVPQFDFMIGNGERHSQISGFSYSNWLQCVENGMDPAHVTFSHFDVLTDLGAIPDRMEFEEMELGTIHKTYRDRPEKTHSFYREQHLLMPGIVVSGAGQRLVKGSTGDAPAVFIRWTVPMSDTESMMFHILYIPAENGGHAVDTTNDGMYARWTPVKIEPFKEYRGPKRQPLGYVLPASIPVQDATILDSMGPISDRENEHLVSTDEGIGRLRKQLITAIEMMNAGKDPPGVFRTPAMVMAPAYERMIEMTTA